MSYILTRKMFAYKNLIQIEFVAHEEDSAPDFEDAKDTQFALDNSSNAGWFNAEVFARVIGTEVRSESNYLGCCSYATFEEFYNDQYFKDMCEEAAANLLLKLPEEIRKHQSAIQVMQALITSEIA